MESSQDLCKHNRYSHPQNAYESCQSIELDQFSHLPDVGGGAQSLARRQLGPRPTPHPNFRQATEMVQFDRLECCMHLTWRFSALCVLGNVVQIPQSHERAPTSYFWPNFLYRVKVYLNEHPAGSELDAYLRLEVLCSSLPKFTTGRVCEYGEANAACTVSNTRLW